MKEICINIKVKNDHANYHENFWSSSINLDKDDPYLKSMIDQVKAKFNQPISEMKIKATMKGGADDWE